MKRNTTNRNVVFVFGSNREGRHGKGAALHALKHYGAIYGQAEGRQGMSYGIVTKELRKNYRPVTLEEVCVGIKHFLTYAADNPNDWFIFTKIGTGLAGFTEEMILGCLSMFFLPPNVRVPDDWLVILQK